jgi:glycosyltransferase involved in cell wall biosynthesis
MSGSNRVRIVLVSPSFGAYGGIEAFVFAIAESVARDPRFDVRICFKRVANFQMQATLDRYCRHAGVEFCDRASRALWSRIAWADVVHAQNASPDVAVMAKLLRKPLAVTIHDFLPAAPRLRRLSWLLGARAASVRWYNSQSVWTSWEPNGGIDGSARVPTVSRLPSGYVEPRARTGFLFIGRLVDSKGVETLIDAYVASGVSAEKWPLTIIGEGPLRRELEDRCARTAAYGARFLGFVDDDAKARALASAKWLVAPSHAHEGLGLVAIEARHVGVPCIIARHGGLPEAGGRDALLCEPQDVAGLARALQTAAAMSDTEYAQRSARTKADLEAELVPLSFYADAYLDLVASRGAR